MLLSYHLLLLAIVFSCLGFPDTLLQKLATTPRIFAGLILWLLVFAYLVLESFLYLSSFLWAYWDDDNRYQTLVMVQLIELMALVFTNGLKCRNKCEFASIPCFCFPTGLIEIDLRQILDGYESLESRNETKREEQELKERITIQINNNNLQGDIPMTEINNNIQGSNIANFANEIKDNARVQATQHIHQAPNQNLTDAAKEIKDLLDQLDKDYDRNSPTGQAMINAKAIEAIEKNRSLKDRVINALKESGTTALEELVDHPAIKILVAALKGFTDSK